MLMRTFYHKDGEFTGENAVFVQVGATITIISYDKKRLDCLGPINSRLGITSSNYYCRHINPDETEIIDQGSFPLEARGLEELYLLFISHLPESLREMVMHLLGLN